MLGFTSVSPCPSAQELGRTVKRLQNRNHRRLDSRLIEVGTTLAQWGALRAIHEHPGASAHEIAEQTFRQTRRSGRWRPVCSKRGSSIGGPGKGRAVVHCLTDEGRLMVERGSAIAPEAGAAAFAALSEVERRGQWGLLQKALSIA